MAILREPMQATQFTQVPNHWTRDRNLSLKGLGLLVYITSHAATCNLTVRQIIAQFPDGESAVRSATKELERLGYLVRHRERKNGRWLQYDYEIVEFPQVDSTRDLPGWTNQAGSTSLEEPQVGNHVLRTPPENTTKEDSIDQSSGDYLSPVAAEPVPSVKKDGKDHERETSAFSDRNEFPTYAHRALGKLGYNTNWRNYLIDRIVTEHEPYSDGWWIVSEKNGTLQDIAKEMQDDWMAANRR